MPAFDAIEQALMRRFVAGLVSRAVVEPPAGAERLHVVALLGPGGRVPVAREHTAADAERFARDINAVLVPRS